MFKSRKVKKAVLPVGGLGTRFLPATKCIPKEMLPVVDRPLIQYAIDEARAAGIEEFCFVTARGKGSLIDYFDIAFELETTLTKRDKQDALETLKSSSIAPGCMTAVRQQVPLGLGHAVWCARSFIGNDPFAVILPDDMIISKKPCLGQLLDVFDEHQGHVVAVETVPEDRVHRYGVVKPSGELEGGRVIKVSDLVEKPKPEVAPSNQAIIGRYVLLPSVIEALEKQKPGQGGEIQLTDALRTRVQDNDPFFAVKFEGTRYDCGDKLGFLEAQIAVARERADLGPQFQEIINSYASK